VEYTIIDGQIVFKREWICDEFKWRKMQ
jgi:hypothetical protein